jgi:hypothetical protein
MPTGRQDGERSQQRHRFLRWVGLWLGLGLVVVLSGCTLPQVSAEDRLFLPLQVELLDVFTLPPQTFAETPVGGLSALTYDPQRNVFYALSDDRGGLAPPRFYTLNIAIAPAPDQDVEIRSVDITSVTFLKDANGELYPANQLDPEGLVLSPRQTLFISSEGVAANASPPTLQEYDLASGTLLTEFRVPDRFLPSPAPDDESLPRGVRDNLGFESLTLNPTASTGAFEPFRLFLATESALAQDFDENPENPLTNRFLHYLIGPDQSTLIAEHAYSLSLEPLGAVSNGLSEILSIDQGGHFLALERVFGIRGFEVKLFQLATGGATDISTLPQLSTLEGIRPIQKQLVLDLSTLAVPVEALDNLEGMTLGPPLPDGSRSLWLISDDNFSPDQSTQIWLFKLVIS